MASTHDLVVTGDVAVKRYTSWDRGEHEREWLVLGALHRRTPGLGPAPISADLRADPPSIVIASCREPRSAAG